MEVWRTEIYAVFNSPVGNSQSLSGFFSVITGVGSSFLTFFDFFPDWVRCFGAKNRIVLWGGTVCIDKDANCCNCLSNLEQYILCCSETDYSTDIQTIHSTGTTEIQVII